MPLKLAAELGVILFMNYSRDVAERLLITYLMSPMIAGLFVVRSPLIAATFLVVFFLVTMKFKQKFLIVLKIGTFPIFFFSMMFIATFFGWFTDYAIENKLHNGAGVMVFILPFILIMTIYTRASDSYKKAIEILSET